MTQFIQFLFVSFYCLYFGFIFSFFCNAKKFYWNSYLIGMI